DRVPVGGDAVEGAIAAAAVPAVHGRDAPAQTLADLGQPIAVGGFVVLVGVHGAVDLFAGQAARVEHVAMGRFEVDALHKVAVHRTTPAQVGRAAEQGDLRARCLDRQFPTGLLPQLRGPRPCSQDQGPRFVTPFVRVHADDFAFFRYDGAD